MHNRPSRQHYRPPKTETLETFAHQVIDGMGNGSESKQHEMALSFSQLLKLLAEILAANKNRSVESQVVESHD